MSNAWGTPAEHDKTVRERMAAEKGQPITEETKTDETTTEFTVEVPTVVLPDGSQMKVDEFDPYAKEREAIIADRGRIDGVMSLLEKQVQSGDPNNQNSGEPEEKKPLFSPIEFNEEEVVVGQTDKVLADGINELGQLLSNSQNQENERLAKVEDVVNKLATTVGNKFLEDEINAVSAKTGFSRDELIQANEETGIDDPQMVAVYLRGKKADEEAAAAAAKAAQEERVRKAAGINGTSSGSDTGTGEEARAKINFRDAAEVAKHFNFAPVAD